MSQSTANVGATTNVSNTWRFQENYVERIMDNAAFTAAHPNNTLVLAGPARYPSIDNLDELLPVGMIQNMSLSYNRPLQPMQALGSARTFFTAGKGVIQFQIGRLLVNGRNLLRAMYTQAVQGGITADKFEEAPVANSMSDETFYADLDSEIFYIPIGLAVLFRSVSKDNVGGFYIELGMIQSYNVGLRGGGANILENVSGMADRIRPIKPSKFSVDGQNSKEVLEGLFSATGEVTEIKPTNVNEK